MSRSGEGQHPSVIISVRNPRVAAARRLHRAKERRQTGHTLIEGPHLLEAAAHAGGEIVEVFGLSDDEASRALADRVGAGWLPVTQAVLERLAPTEHPRGPVAVIEIPLDRPPAGDLIWFDLADPGNAGTLIRTAAAFGLGAVTAPDAVDPWSPKVLRAGAGGHFQTTVSTGTPPPDRGTIATVVRGGIDPQELGTVLDPGRHWSLLIGSEAHGLDSHTIEEAEIRLTLPMPGGTESLNAAVAGAISIYELWRWRVGADATKRHR